MDRDTTALLPTFHFSAALRLAYLHDNNWDGFLAKFFPTRALIPGVRSLLPVVGPYLAWARRPEWDAAGDEEETVWFPASVQHKDGSVTDPTEEEIEAFSVSYEDTQ
jgi:hypothetical protein